MVSHRHLRIEGGQLKWSRGTHIQQESKRRRNRKNMTINLFQRKRSHWVKQLGKEETCFCERTSPWKGSKASWVIIWYILLWRRELYSLKMGWRISVLQGGHLFMTVLDVVMFFSSQLLISWLQLACSSAWIWWVNRWCKRLLYS